ncbi:MarC family protein [Elizabethkingia sp. JS20170427COW]|uniref:MarC family protein n=1 Tax=Elizabethkingia sp. JS20170427COW TaxID=2583851 RepID=UPI001110B1D2|nr:MarC family protein [Elizabethkingia sp. JS20170427COW]QCX53936.1 MarC family protein [Elizabethkingia sp. JS20170427COW]
MLENFSLKETLTCFMVLFAVIDVVGSIPIFVNLKKRFGEIESEKTTLVAGGIMIAFLFIGDKMLKLIGVDVNSFAIAGAFVIFVIAIEMILGIEINKPGSVNSASIVPIAFPLIAGAGCLTTVLSLKSSYHNENIVLGIILNIIVVYFVLKSASWLERKLGENTLHVLQKVFGIVLLAISIKLFTINFAELIKVYFQF